MKTVITEFTEKWLPGGGWGLLFTYVPGNVFSPGMNIYIESLDEVQAAKVVSVTNYNGYQDILVNREYNGEDMFTISDKPLSGIELLDIAPEETTGSTVKPTNLFKYVLIAFGLFVLYKIFNTK
jgi:hypothetical protein